MIATTDAYLNGEFLPLEQCTVSVLDRGFIFGDSVYELIPVYGRRPFRLDQHLTRLQRSLEQIQIADPYGRTKWVELVNELIRRAEWDNSYVYIQVTRGVAPRDHAYPTAVIPTVFSMVKALPELSSEALSEGLRMITVEDIRWDRCDIKVTSLLANVMLKQRAVSDGCHEAIFVRDGKMLEGSASNIYAVVGDTVYTAPKNNLILPGITRDFILELLQGLAIPVKHEALDATRCGELQELWMSSSTKEVLPVTQLNGKKIGSGKPGPLWRKVFDAFQQRKTAARDR